MRLNFELTPTQMDQINNLKAKTAAASMKELFNNALTILDWAVDETISGNDIAAMSMNDKSYRVFVTPLLRQARAQHRKQPAAMAD